MEQKALEDLQKKSEICKISQNKRHFFICTGPKCCDKDYGMKIWDHIKGRLKDSKFSGVYRSKADCLRLCQHGPIAVVYPEGVWYGKIDEKNIDRILDEHLAEGKVVEDLCFAIKPLP